MGVVLTPREHAIISEEGFRPSRYKDTLGNSTLGYGFASGPATNMRTISEPQALELFRQYYLPIAEKDARSFVGEDIFNKLGPSRQLALIDMAYNLGLKRLSKFQQARKAIVSGDFDTAGKEILNSKYANQLPNRARRNALRMVRDYEGE